MSKNVMRSGKVSRNSEAAWITTSIRGLAAEVEFDHQDVGLDQPSVINCDGLHTLPRSALTSYIGNVDELTMGNVCSAVSYALGC